MYVDNQFPGVISPSRLIWLTGLGCLKGKGYSISEGAHCYTRQDNGKEIEVVGTFYLFWKRRTPWA